MNLSEAIELQKIIAREFLFSRTLQPAYAGDWDDEPANAKEIVYDLFNYVIGIGIVGEGPSYGIQLLSDTDLYMRPIWDYFGVPPEEITMVPTSEFTLRSSRKRPLEIGCSVSHRAKPIMGTLGCFVKGLHDNQTYILSNHHVLYNSSDLEENFIVQPCAYSGGGAADAIGLYYRSLPYFHSDVNEHDAAIAGPISEAAILEIPGRGTVIKGVIDARNGQKVYKIGAKSGLTFGRIKNFITEIKVAIDGDKYEFTDQILIEGFDNQFDRSMPFSEEGDSGSLIVDLETDRAIGLLFAGNKEGITLANRLQPILEKLEIDF